MRALLADVPDVLVGTANQLQGMERPAAVVLHPLAGYRDPNAFGTDLGRACVIPRVRVGVAELHPVAVVAAVLDLRHERVPFAVLAVLAVLGIVGFVSRHPRPHAYENPGRGRRSRRSCTRRAPDVPGPESARLTVGAAALRDGPPEDLPAKVGVAGGRAERVELAVHRPDLAQLGFPGSVRPDVGFDRDTGIALYCISC